MIFVECKSMRKRKISVIVPVYNTEKELPRCLESIVNQTYSFLEIICVDDGSTDASGRIADHYSKKDSRITVIHQKNQGESNARNKALEEAGGDYIAFVDCDDWIDRDMYEVLLSEAVENDLDISAVSWYKSTDKQDLVIKNTLQVSTGIFGREEFLKYIYMRDSYRGFAYMWNKLFKKNVLLDGQGRPLRFDERLRLGGDVLFLAEAALHAEKIKYTDRPFYHYYQRSNSGCHTTDLEKMRDWILAYQSVLQRFYKENVSGDIIRYVKRFMAYHSSNAVRMAVEQGDTDWKRYFQAIMRENEKEYVELNAEHSERIASYLQLMEV